MTTMTAKITSKGQITLPKEIRDRLGVESGDSVRFEIEDGEIKVYPNRQFDFTQLIGAAPLGEEWDGLSASEVIDDLRGEPDERASLREAPAHPQVTYLGDK